MKEIERRNHQILYYDLDISNDRRVLGNESLDAAWFAQIMKESDVIYCEFIEDLALMTAVWKYKKKILTPLVYHLHRIELYNDWVKKLPWNVVNDLVMVAPQCYRKFQAWCPSWGNGMPQRMHLTPNGYDSGLFTIPNDKRYSKTILMAGNFSWKKNQHLALQFMSMMEGWHLTIVGEPWGPWGFEYLINCQDYLRNTGIEDKVTFMNKVSRQELNDKIFASNSVYLSASLEEGTHCTLAEAMLSGLYPMCFCWDGAIEQYPEECIWRNLMELKHKLEWWWSLSTDEKKRASEHYRLYIEKRYDAETQARKFVDILESSYNRSKGK